VTNDVFISLAHSTWPVASKFQFHIAAVVFDGSLC